jgi:hypothetical protein
MAELAPELATGLDSSFQKFLNNVPIKKLEHSLYMAAFVCPALLLGGNAKAWNARCPKVTYVQV